MNESHNIISVSGGKDSTALWLLALERETANATPVFADTGHESPQTLEYLDYLEKKLGPIKRVKADFTRRFEVRRKNLRETWVKRGISEAKIETALAALHPTGIPFLDLCMLNGLFPSTKMRFCTSELKQIPIRKFVIDPLLERESTIVISWQGVRADESQRRSRLDVAEEMEPGLAVYRPLIAWSAVQVFDFHRKHGIKWNPLYEQGMGRVGCMPCIYVKKDELKAIAERFPEELERVREWERRVREVSPHESAAFFSKTKIPKTGEFRTKEEEEEGKGGMEISKAVSWANTARGGRQLTLNLGREDECRSFYGLCE